MNKANLIIEEVNKVIIGKEKVIRKVWMTILSGGHVLLEDVPGVGKTTMALAFSKALGLSYRRIQFTPDVMPSDVVGFYYYNKENGKFEYRQGAVMTNLLLADEINRTSSRTQSALLEVMEEGQVTVDGVTRNIQEPFFVIATQNPLGSAGTQMLPESQMDRFMVLLSMGYPTIKEEMILMSQRKVSDPLVFLSFTPHMRLVELLFFYQFYKLSNSYFPNKFQFIVTIVTRDTLNQTHPKEVINNTAP